MDAVTLVRNSMGFFSGIRSLAFGLYLSAVADSVPDSYLSGDFNKDLVPTEERPRGRLGFPPRLGRKGRRLADIIACGFIGALGASSSVFSEFSKGTLRRWEGDCFSWCSF